MYKEKVAFIQWYNCRRSVYLRCVPRRPETDFEGKKMNLITLVLQVTASYKSRPGTEDFIYSGRYTVGRNKKKTRALVLLFWLITRG